MGAGFGGRPEGAVTICGRTGPVAVEPGIGLWWTEWTTAWDLSYTNDKYDTSAVHRLLDYWWIGMDQNGASRQPIGIDSPP